MTHETDIIIVGAGPAGLSLARSLANSGLKITQIDIQPKENISNPIFDGREIALTHPSRKILQHLNIWQKIPANEIYLLKEALVRNANSPFLLHFPQPTTTSKGEEINTLGYLISNHLIRRAAYEAVLEQDNVHFIFGQRVVSCEADDLSARVTLNNGEIILGKLLVAADSRFSSIREARGIAADTHEFGRHVIVFRVQHELPHNNTAVECFFYGSTLALLPLHDNVTNCVITIDSDKAPQIMEMAKTDALAKFVEDELNSQFGKMELISTAHDYKLVSVHARKFHAKRTALIGDAACGMHPVTAQGYNLGLQSQDILSRLILRQYGMGLDIGADSILETYNRRHQLNTRPIYHGTNTIVKLFTKENHIAKALRHSVLRVSNILPPLKKIITRQLTG